MSLLAIALVSLLIGGGAGYWAAPDKEVILHCENEKKEEPKPAMVKEAEEPKKDKK